MSKEISSNNQFPKEVLERWTDTRASIIALQKGVGKIQKFKSGKKHVVPIKGKEMEFQKLIEKVREGLYE